MQLIGFPYQTIDWSLVAPTFHPGDPGIATARTVQAGAVRIRQVEYPPGYVADHWCEKGHVVFVIEGELLNELRDGPTSTVTAGQCYVVADGDGSHRSRSPKGARLLIVD